MRQEQIRTFLEVVRTRNITMTATNLYLSQSAVSAQLRSLEEELGFQLVIRRRGIRSVELTEQGQRFIPLAEEWMRLMDRIGDLKQTDAPTLTIGTVDSLAANCVFPVCALLTGEKPELRVRVVSTQFSDLYRQAEEREIDFGLVSEQKHHPDVNVRPVFRERMCVVRRGGAGDAPVTHPTELDPAKEIDLHWGQELERWHEKWFPDAPRGGVTIDSVVLLQKLLQEEGRWAVIPELSFTDLQDSSLEICDLGENEPPDRRIYAVSSVYTSKNGQVLLEEFLRCLGQFARKHPSVIPD